MLVSLKSQKNAQPHQHLRPSNSCCFMQQNLESTQSQKRHGQHYFTAAQQDILQRWQPKKKAKQCKSQHPCMVLIALHFVCHWTDKEKSTPPQKKCQNELIGKHRIHQSLTSRSNNNNCNFFFSFLWLEFFNFLLQCYGHGWALWLFCLGQICWWQEFVQFSCGAISKSSLYTRHFWE